MTKINVVVVDDHDLFRRGLIDVLSEEADINVVGQARDGIEAVERVEELSPDVVCMDLNMPNQGGIKTTAELASRCPDVKVLILTVSEEATDLFQALGMGALGYVLKTASPKEIVDALRQVHQGWVVISPAMAPRMLADLGTSESVRSMPQTRDASEGYLTQLTLREEEILRLVGQAMSNAEIARALVLSENTVKTHIKNILSKLHVKNRSQAAQVAMLNQLRSAQSPGER
ncbi:MAG: response regulator transcription factor [Chloroflexi bacterium]|nr:response regulator transcription factor [Chloroflexota bacterium]